MHKDRHGKTGYSCCWVSLCEAWGCSRQAIQAILSQVAHLSSNAGALILVILYVGLHPAHPVL